MSINKNRPLKDKIQDFPEFDLQKPEHLFDIKFLFDF